LREFGGGDRPIAIAARILAPTNHSSIMELDDAKEQTVAETHSYSIILEPQEDGGFTVLVPALPEVVTEADTEEQALANAQEAIRAILEFRRDHGLSIPVGCKPNPAAL
jgi:antitoxin HicB